METPSQKKLIPNDFIWKRLHSLAGLWLTLYIIVHLLTNSQAALFVGDDGRGFIHDVNFIHSLPYLPVIEIMILAVPIGIHAIWGIMYLMTGRSNSTPNSGNKPYLPYGRNKAYTWQRITAWILLFGIAAHVIHMRFIEYPEITKEGRSTLFTIEVQDDPGLYSLQKRIAYGIKPGSEGKVFIQADNFGTVALLMLRDTFKSPLMIALYTIFTLTACFHAFNGLWTFMITWGITLSERSQKIWLHVCQGLMVLVAFMGLAAIFGTYWINLRQ